MPLLPSALPPKGEARRYVANDFLNLIALSHRGRGTAERCSGTLIIVDLRRSFPPSFIPPVPYPPLRGTFPSRGRLTIRESPLLKRRRATLVNPSAPPLRHPERSRGIFLARPPYARMRPHSNDTLVLPFIAFLSLTFYRSAKRIPSLRPS